MWAKDLDVKVMWSLKKSDLNVVFKPGTYNQNFTEYNEAEEIKKASLS